MTIPFTKLHGAKNDFLLTRVSDAPAENLPKLAVRICDRFTGVGGDGWMLVDPSPTPDSDAGIRLFNSDGEHPEQTDFRIRTGAGIKHLRLIERRGLEYWFEMNMGEIRVLDLHAQVQGRDAVLVNAGNPQCVFPVADFDFDWRAVGAATERDPIFPNRTNVSFVKKIDAQTIDVRFWERGAGETNSSGTGSTGAAVAAAARGLVESPVTVQTPAGPLLLNLSNGVKLTGPAEFVAEGTYFT
jgi:diaminopimelate epimerase